MTTVRDIETFLYAWAPRETAESWDNVGLLVGRGDREVRRVLAALDVTPAVAAEGDRVSVLLPLYGQIAQRWREKMNFRCYIYVDLGWRHEYCGLFSLEYRGVTWYFADNERYFRRRGLYGDMDEFVKQLQAEGITEVHFIGNLEQKLDFVPGYVRTPWMISGMGILYGRK